MEKLNNTKKINKVLLIFIFLFVTAFLVFLVIFLKLERSLIDEEGRLSNGQNQNWDALTEADLVEGEVPSEEVLLEPISKLASRQNYLLENISELSPIKEVLGGTFYITEFNWFSEDLVAIKYEDGHIALEAEVSFDYDLAPSNFVITKEN